MWGALIALWLLSFVQSRTQWNYAEGKTANSDAEEWTRRTIEGVIYGMKAFLKMSIRLCLESMRAEWSMAQYLPHRAPHPRQEQSHVVLLIKCIWQLCGLGISLAKPTDPPSPCGREKKSSIEPKDLSHLQFISCCILLSQSLHSRWLLQHLSPFSLVALSVLLSLHPLVLGHVDSSWGVVGIAQ
jgi:hypothetical protein